MATYSRLRSECRPVAARRLCTAMRRAEIYHVLEGQFTFYVGQPPSAVRRVEAVAGDVVPLAGNTPHTIRNESSSDAVAFVVHSPAATMEGFSRAAAAMAAQGSPGIEDVLALAEQHGIEMLGPVPR